MSKKGSCSGSLNYAVWLKNRGAVIHSMTGVFVFCLLVLVQLAGAESKVCLSSGMGNSSSNFPDSINKNEVLKVASIDSNSCGIAMKKWPYQKNTYVLYSEARTGDNEYVMDRIICLLEKVNKSFVVRARYESSDHLFAFESFDFAPYSIKKNRVAIGIRFGKQGATHGGSFRCSKLALFAPDQGELPQVFESLSDYTADGNGVAYDSETGFEYDFHAIFKIAKPDRSGYHRIERVAQNSKLVYVWGENGYQSNRDRENELDCIGDSVEYCFCNE